ncbi:MarR family winged helix-turn-helix transcriptional regulator [Jongsikchunia kroppenstedtii]|uniref:MarR family winged helix-turn-helix transcriptional regulator n=1 Tax=Jongsikchunia kroppenstedtii TaxID=1121721 RepID=UPI000379A8B8|nr:MarR family transcriptional regulator [Jongsikchunia kroppenstedtii]
MSDDVCDEELAAQWHRLTVRFHKLNCTIDRTLQTNAQVSASEFETLEQLTEADGKMRMSELSDLVHLSQSALSRLVTGLEKNGYVNRTMCDSDRRSVFVQLTDAGAAKYAEAKVVQRAVLRSEVSRALLQADGETRSTGLCGADEFAAAARAHLTV